MITADGLDMMVSVASHGVGDMSVRSAIVLLVVCLALGAPSPVADTTSTSSVTAPATGVLTGAVPSGLSTGLSPVTIIGRPADDGARIVAVEVLGPRTRDLSIESPTVGTVSVRLLLPTTYETRPTARFPALYLLHGGGGEYVDWTEETDVEGYTAPTDLLVVMPAAATSSMDTWQPQGGQVGAEARPNWETFHLTELRQLLERNWRAGEDRVVGGLSLGGWSAVMYAARHPGLFRAAGSYSGVLDITVAPGRSAEAQEAVELATAIARAAGWDEANPINLVPALEGTTLYISYGNGEPGPLDPADREADELEAWVGEGDDHFVAALDETGIPAIVDRYGPGTHSWPYWDRALQASLPFLLDALGGSPDVPPTPSSSMP